LRKPVPMSSLLKEISREHFPYLPATAGETAGLEQWGELIED